MTCQQTIEKIAALDDNQFKCRLSLYEQPNGIPAIGRAESAWERTK